MHTDEKAVRQLTILLADGTVVSPNPVMVSLDPSRAAPTEVELLTASAVEVVLPSWDRYRDAKALATELFASVGRTVPTILVRLHVYLEDTSTVATRSFDAEVGRNSPVRRDRSWYVGTRSGLVGLLKDLKSLGIGEGAVIVPYDDRCWIER